MNKLSDDIKIDSFRSAFAGKSIRCYGCNKILAFNTSDDLCPTCHSKSSQTYVYSVFDMTDMTEYPLEFEKEEYYYLREHSYLE